MTDQHFEIKVEAPSGLAWKSRFEEIDILPLGNEQYLLKGNIQDAPALYGLLGRIRSAGLVLISVGLIPCE